MSKRFLKNPLSLFDIKGKTAISNRRLRRLWRTRRETFAGAGANIMLAASKAEELKKVAAECERLGGKRKSSLSGRARRKIPRRSSRPLSTSLDVLTFWWSLQASTKYRRSSIRKSQDFLDVMDANVNQSWLMARAAGKQMLKQGQGGKVILTSSARGLLGHPAGYTAYCASKSAVDGITKALGCEWGETGITVNALGPTVFRSPLTAWMYEDTERAQNVRKGFLARVPKGRLGEPEDLAGPLLFLASKASDFYTGHILYADGGYTAG